MDTYHAAHWSDPCYSSSEEEEESCYRITHHQRTKQHGNGQHQRSQDSWTWEEILDGKGHWAQAVLPPQGRAGGSESQEAVV